MSNFDHCDHEHGLCVLTVKIERPIVVGKVTDIETLQHLAKVNWELYCRATDRLRKARQQRNEAKAKIRELKRALSVARSGV